MELQLINLINDVIKCMQQQYSYISCLGIVTADLENNFKGVIKRITEFEDERIKILPIVQDLKQEFENEDENVFTNIKNVNEALGKKQETKFPQNEIEYPETKIEIVAEIKCHSDIEDDSSDEEEFKPPIEKEKLLHCLKLNEIPKLSPFTEDEDAIIMDPKKRTNAKKNNVGEKTKKPRKKHKIQKCREAVEKFRTGPSDRPYQCIKCNKCFLNFLTFTRHVHMREHLGYSSNICEICSKNLSSKTQLAEHMRGHKGEKIHECEICNGKYATRLSLKVHKATQHAGKRPYLCNVCGSSFTQIGSLQSHLRIHTGETPYKCDVCGNVFSQPHQLRTHKYKHFGKPYICEICSRGFGSNGNLKTHMKTHTNERPYACELCGSKFKTAGHLKRHGNSHMLKQKKWTESTEESSYIYGRAAEATRTVTFKKKNK